MSADTGTRLSESHVDRCADTVVTLHRHYANVNLKFISAIAFYYSRQNSKWNLLVPWH